VGHGNNKFDMASTLAAHLLLGNLHTTTVADDALIADALVLAATALVVLGGTEDALAEKTVALGLIGAVVDSLGFSDLTITTLEDFLGRSKSDGNLREIILYL
jgi:hypothetical protein